MNDCKSPNTLKLGVIFILLLVVAGIAVSILSSTADPGETPAAVETGWTPEGVKETVSAMNRFAFSLYRDLEQSENGNIFFSPYSISAAMAMTYEGAGGRTADEIRTVFKFPDHDILRSSSARLYNLINRAEKAYTLRTGNALWIEKTFALRAEFIETVAKYYGGKAVNLDFINNPDDSREIINSYIAEQTNDRIKELLPPGIPDPLTRLILTNAIYFLGDWKYQFDEDKTADLPFYLAPELSVDVPMMFMEPENSFKYADLDEVQILEMPYQDEEISMVVLLPKDKLQTFDLDYGKFIQYKEKMRKTRLDGIYLPKFELETEYGLNQHLKNLGMPTAFSRQADFSGLNEREELYISEVIHKAFIKVDEEGTEAAAATAVVIRMTAAIPPRNIFRADRPFIFVIQENTTGNILFMGRISDPR